MPDRSTRLAAALTLLAVGCASGPTALYEGAPRDRSRIAVLRRAGSHPDVTVFRIDDTDTRGFEWHMEPGPHRVWVKLLQYGTALNVEFTAWSYCWIDFETRAGDDYQIVSENNQEAAGADTAVTLGTRIVDGRGMTVGEPECSGRAPRFR